MSELDTAQRERQIAVAWLRGAHQHLKRAVSTPSCTVDEIVLAVDAFTNRVNEW